MSVIETIIHVAADGRVTGQVPGQLPPGDYRVIVELPPRPAARLDLPVHDAGPWPDELSLRREDLYGDDGR